MSPTPAPEPSGDGAPPAGGAPAPDASSAPADSAAASAAASPAASAGASPPPRGRGEASREGHGFTLFLACAALVGVFLLGVLRGRPLEVESGTATRPERFDGAAASAALDEALRAADGLPHPVGSDANRRVRDWIVERLRRDGVEARVERRWVVAPTLHRCATVENVVARIEAPAGRGRGRPAVFLLAHYDSVPAGPGAADDLSGVVVLIEAARALRAGPPLRRDLVLLFTDGEEAGLLGARAHVRAHGVDDVAAVINVEARGTRGPSLMFEAGSGTSRTVPAWTARASRALTSSLFDAVYREMPNDTDFTVFRDEGVPGLNFAFVGGVQHYHTPLDSAERLDARSIQHHGDNVVAAARGLAADDAPLDSGEGEPGGAGDLVWFDVLGLFVVSWGVSLSPALACGALGAHLLLTLVHVFRRRAHLLGAVAGMLAAAAAIAGGLGAAHGVAALLARTGALPGPFVASPSGAVAAAAGAVALVAGALAVLAGRFVAPLSLSCGTWLAWSGAAVALSFEMAGASYLLVVPALVAAVVAAARVRVPGPAADAAGVVAAAVLALPLVPPIADAMGVVPLLWVAAPFALAAVPFLPLVAAGGARRWWVAAGGALLLCAGAAAAATSRPWTSEWPRPVNVSWVRDTASRHAHWFVASPTGLPGSLRGAAEFGDETERIVPWEGDRAWAAEAPTVDLPPPVLEGLSVQSVDGSRRVRFRLVSRRGAPLTTLSIVPTARLRRATIGGAPVAPESLRAHTSADSGTATRSGPIVITCLTTPPEGLEVDLDFADEAPVDAFVSDRSWGLPPGADAILRARPEDAAPIGNGDTTIVYRKLQL